MDHEPRHKYRNGVDWHRVTFTACLGVAVLLAVLSLISKDGRVSNLLDPGGRDQMRRILIVHHPDIARWFGLGALNATPKTRP